MAWAANGVVRASSVRDAMQSVLLVVLVTFIRTSWYSGYAATTAPLALDPLTDQQLGGAIMWIPAGRIYLVVELACWSRGSERPNATMSRAEPTG